jgi:hypothetical protein
MLVCFGALGFVSLSLGVQVTTKPLAHSAVSTALLKIRLNLRLAVPRRSACRLRTAHGRGQPGL